ncbi:eEF1A lysine and N-terminal methyltransferase isoform X1 [Tachypleus tridentatus]|uniref:eEF1A lysine and N-terminal methyltransferase isoform X1 n=2 Tax=Tachypleus tridentatus TaxID=6853 RepID=UPI003FD10F88
MNLLPKSHTEFASETYWDSFFKKRGKLAFEWYGEYPQLCGLLHKYVRTSDQLLVVGCGNSSLSADLYDVGFHQNTSIDISDVVIHQMIEKYSRRRPGMKYQKMDMLEMAFKDGEFTVVLDKGTLDALMTDASEETVQKIEKMFGEIKRVLRLGGRYICISLLQEHILEKLLSWFTNEGWIVRIHRCTDAEEESDEGQSSVIFPVFMVVCTKFKKLPGTQSVLELCLSEDGLPVRLESPDAVIKSIQSLQHYAFLRSKLTSKHLEEVTVDLCDPQNEFPRYSLFVVDRRKASSLKFAIFIVPQGRESEWLFGTPSGRQHLAQNANANRLVVVHLSRNHSYSNLEDVKAELSSKVMELAPPQLDPKLQIPFLSVGEDVGCREVCYRGCSIHSGEFSVEDVSADGELYRRLIFLNNPSVIQSEAKLRQITQKKKKGKKLYKTVIDTSFLSCQHHAFMVAGLGFLDHDVTEQETRLLVIGLGGGGLVSYIHNNFPKVSIDSVELDPAVVSVATEWFGLKADNRLFVEVADGIDVINRKAEEGKHYDAVLLDVDSKDTSEGLNCPPASFVTPDILQKISTIVAPAGLAMFNLVCRNESFKKNVLSVLNSVFKSVYSKKIPDEVNEVVYGFLSRDIKIRDNTVKQKLFKLMKTLKKEKTEEDLIDVTKLMNEINIV